MQDSYLKSCDSQVKTIRGNQVSFDRTVFHPLSGGVANDLGKILHFSKRYDVIDIREDKDTDDVTHALSETPPFKEGEVVTMELDWDRRYMLMRLHTAAHILSSIMYGKYGAMVTGGHIEPSGAKDDFNVERADRAIFEDAIDEANIAVSRGVDVKVYYLPREEAIRIPGIVKLADRMPPQLMELRIVEITGIDIQADGGPHVRNTSEIGKIELTKVENKGKNRKRLYYEVK
jgi:misacylated tRNA(Ala) deacylase